MFIGIHCGTGLCHSLSVMNEVGGKLMFRGVVDMSHGEVDSSAGSMYVQVRRTCQLQRMPIHRTTHTVSMAIL